jgi:phasin family protein
MQNEIFEAANKASEAAYATVKEIAALNVATVETLVEKQFELVNQAVDLSVKQVKLATESKDPQVAIRAQVALVEDAAEQALDNVRDLVAIANKTRVAYDKLLDKNIKEAATKLEAVTKPKVKKAA